MKNLRGHQSQSLSNIYKVINLDKNIPRILVTTEIRAEIWAIHRQDHYA